MQHIDKYTFEAHDLINNLDIHFDRFSQKGAIEILKRIEHYLSKDDGLGWVLLAELWFKVSQIFNLDLEEAERCLLFAEPLQNFIEGRLPGLKVWLGMANCGST